ncbi:MAG TPA: hypothetical protein VGW10_19015 [Solirubrobacteraceae bacterium]|nr:hypothetical protein [Solirubrobacteraceae bacterium]
MALLCLAMLATAAPPAQAQDPSTFNCERVHMGFGWNEDGPADTNVSGYGECFSTSVGGAAESFSFSGPGRIVRVRSGSSCYYRWDGTLAARSRTSARSFTTGMTVRMSSDAQLMLDSGQRGRAPTVDYQQSNLHWLGPADECWPDSYTELRGMSFDNGTIAGVGFTGYTERNDAIMATTAPSIEGVPQEGAILRVNEGTWTHPMPGFSFQWWRCTATSCSGPIARERTYVPVAADVGARLYVTVRAITGAGYNTANTALTEPIRAAPAPVSSAPPQLGGNAVQGQRLTTSTGAWSSAVAPTYRYAWLRCDVNGAACATIPGATQSVYTMVQADIGSTIRSQVTATNTSGSATARSAPSAVVQPATPVS